MQCRCGYCFAKEALKKPKPYESFAVVNDKDYPKFLRSEIKLVEAGSDKARLNAAWQSLKYVGTLEVCPECGVLSWHKPGAKHAEYFERLEESES